MNGQLPFVLKGPVTPSRFGSPELYRSTNLRFSGIGTSTAAQRYHIAKNGSTSSGHRQNIGEDISNGRRRYKVLNMLKNFCRCAAGASNGTTTAVLRYGFVNVGRAPVSLRYSSGQRWARNPGHDECHTRRLLLMGLSLEHGFSRIRTMGRGM